MERFDTRERRNETPNLRPHDVEQISNEFEERLEWNEIRSKVRAKILAKEKLSRDDGTNDRADWKRLGIFLINERTLGKDICRTLQNNGVDLYEDETVIELHIPPQNVVIAEIQDSIARLCEYLQTLEREAKSPIYIYGVSYLSKLAKRYGFKVAELPSHFRESSGAAHLLSNYTGSTDEKKRKIAERYKTNDIQICYSSVNDFIKGVVRDERYQERLHRYHTKRKLSAIIV